MMKAHEIAAVFEQIAPISSGTADDRRNNFLGFRFGDRNLEVGGVGVAWWLADSVVEQAIARKLNLLICHEPELFRGWNSPFHSNMEALTVPYNLRKMRRLLEHNISVYTAHTNWDLQQEVGMGPTLAEVLGFKKLIKHDVAVHVYEVGPLTLEELIAQVKTRMGLKHVRYAGDLKLKIKRLVLGWGSMGSELEAIIVNQADAGIFGELREWPFLFAGESGVGIIETTHTVSESLGFRSVVTELRKRLPQVPCEFLEVPFPYQLG